MTGPVLDFTVPAQRRPERRRPAPRYGTSYAGPGIAPDPVTPLVMPAEVGAAIRALVLPARYLANSSPIERCSCQYGLCGGCERGRCDRCLTIQLGGSKVHPETHIVTRRWFVAGAPGVASSEVWRVGTPCRYRCPCQCSKTPPAPRVEHADVVQLGLFDLADHDEDWADEW